MKYLASFCLLALSCAAQVQTVNRPVRMYTPKDADVYCAGYMSDKPPLDQLYVVAGEEGGLKQQFSDRDTIFLSRGAGSVVNPGGEYLMVREIRDQTKVEIFEGQNKLMKSLGKVYAETGRIRVDRVSQYVATATVTSTCGEIVAGDVAIPLNARPTPAAPSGTFDRFAPPSGKTEGIIATGKEFENTLGAGRVAYINVGADSGVAVGQLFRVYRSYTTSGTDPNRKSLEQTPDTVLGQRQSYKLSKSQKAIMPRDIIGEMVILSVTGKTASALITMSSAEIFPGDGVEMK